MSFRPVLFLLMVVLLVAPAQAQVASPLAAQGSNPFMTPPQKFKIEALTVEGIEGDYSAAFIQQISGLSVGKEVVIPGDPAFGEAIRALYRLGLFSDVKIVEEQRVADGVFLAIQVREVPKLADYSFTGVKKRHRKDLQEAVPLIKRSPVKAGSEERAVQAIKDFYKEKGNPLATVNVVRTVNPDNTLLLDFQVDPGPKVEVGQIIVNGNEEVPDRVLRKAMETKQDVWWRFWKKNTLKLTQLDTDLTSLASKYGEKGYFNARVLRDSVYLVNEGDKPEYVIEIDVEEGDQYHVRNIMWEGNTLYKDEVLSEMLGLQKGDVFNSKTLDENLNGNKRSSDIASLYMNQGYMRFNAQPSIRVVEGDSLDLSFDLFEGEVYRFGRVGIAGNRKTKEHVVRRELLTIPGQTFSRDSIQESVRRLLQLNYFTQESLAGGPGIDIDEAQKRVDLTYSLEETGSDQLELSGTWGRFGLVLQLRFSFNNFSSKNMFKKGGWKPVPSGDGQKVSVGVQTNGRYYQQYSLSFTEPWFRGKPTPVGFSLSYSRIGQNPFYSQFSRFANTGSLTTTSANVFYEKRLKWPDDFFSTSTSLGYQFFNNEEWISTLPNGISQEITVRQTLSRNSTDHPYFPTRGSKMQLSLEIAPPIADLIQYHKWRLKTSWNAPLTPKLAIGIGADIGYIGSLTGEEVEFQRFVLGGSPFETQGFFSFFGKDVVYMRSYPIAALGPRKDNDPIGGRVLNKMAAEVRLLAIQTEQLQAVPYLFATGANTWFDVKSYNPANLYRSAGFGTRLFLPILGMVELTYGYNFDTFEPINNRHDGTKRWTFQFSLGQGFGF